MMKVLSSKSKIAVNLLANLSLWIIFSRSNTFCLGHLKVTYFIENKCNLLYYEYIGTSKRFIRFVH